MKIPSREIPFKELLSHKSFPSVSIFVGNSQPWPGNRRAMLALKGEIKRCRELLKEAEVSDPEIQELLSPILPWAEDAERWQNVAQSLVVYLSKDDFRLYEVDLFLVDSSHVGSVYDVRALIPLREFTSFYVLELSQDKVAMHSVQPSGHETLRVPGLPASFADFTRFNDREKFIQARTFQTTGSKNALFHGHGLVKDSKKSQLDQFAKAIASSVKNKLDDKTDPLVVVGLNPLSSMVLESSLYPDIAFIWDRDPGSESLPTLLAKVRAEYREQLLAHHEKVIETALKSHVSHPSVESRVSEILKKAHEGAVLQLFIRQQDYVWGRYDPEDQQVEVVRARLPETEDLLNLASIYTLRSGGEVFLFDSQRYQSPEHAMAVLRDS